MSRIIFTTATDTEAGKTYISTGLLKAASARKLVTIGIKPVASGCVIQDNNLVNHDALLLQQAASCHLPYTKINPFAFLPPTAPHIAAQEAGDALTVAMLIKHTHFALTTSADLCIIEGFGGWHAPLNSHETMADYAAHVSCGVLLVVGLRIGCMNHAILTERAIKASGAMCIGWIANMIDPDMPHQHETIASLQHWLLSPLLGKVQYGESAETALQHVKII
jgi:dethiobiotin synthetase